MWKPNMATSSTIIFFSLSFICIISNNGVVITASSCSTSEDPNNVPVIGILSHPTPNNNGSYIRASYVKFVEAGGARVIPLIFGEPWTVLTSKLELVNGVILTGGSRKSGLYLEVVKKILQKVKEKKDNGEHFPLYGINLGFELLLNIISESNNVLEGIDAQKLTTNLEYENNVSVQETVLGSFPLALRNKLKTDCLVSFNSKNGISKESFYNDKELSSFFKAITISKDKSNKDFISTIQANDYPIVGFQWNPEKNAFEWGSSEIPHSLDAIRVTQYAASYLVSEARKSSKSTPAKQVLEYLIYKYTPYYTGAKGSGFEQTYYFDMYKSSTSTEALAQE